MHLRFLKQARLKKPLQSSRLRERLKKLTEGEGAVALTIEVGTVAFPKVILSSSGLIVSAITS